MTFAPEPVHPDTWPSIHELLRPAIEQSPNYSAESVIDALVDGTAKLWVYRDYEIPTMACVVELLDGHRGRQAQIILLGGKDPSKWVPLIEVIKTDARANGATSLVVDGRKGWERLLNMRVVNVTMIEDL